MEQIPFGWLKEGVFDDQEQKVNECATKLVKAILPSYRIQKPLAKIEKA